MVHSNIIQNLICCRSKDNMLYRKTRNINASKNNIYKICIIITVIFQRILKISMIFISVFLVLNFNNPTSKIILYGEESLDDTINCSDVQTYEENENTKRIWIDKNIKVLRISSADIANNESSMRQDNTYSLFCKFFSNCSSPLDFYERVNTFIGDAQIIPDIFFCFSINKLAHRVYEGDTRLWCTQQCMLVAAGVKAIFSHWDNDIQRYVLYNSSGDFRIEFWESCCDMIYPYFPLHLQIVVDMWNGNNTPLGYEKLEIDCWNNYIGEWIPENHRNCGIVSIMHTDTISH